MRVPMRFRSTPPESRWGRLWYRLQEHPVRVRMYTLGTAIVGLLVVLGYTTETAAAYWLAILSAALGLATVETTQSRTRSRASLHREAAKIFRAQQTEIFRRAQQTDDG